MLTSVNPLDDSAVSIQRKRATKHFVVDRVFGPQSSQIQVCITCTILYI